MYEENSTTTNFNKNSTPTTNANNTNNIAGVNMYECSYGKASSLFLSENKRSLNPFLSSYYDTPSTSINYTTPLISDQSHNSTDKTVEPYSPTGMNKNINCLIEVIYFLPMYMYI